MLAYSSAFVHAPRLCSSSPEGECPVRGKSLILREDEFSPIVYETEGF